MKDRIKQARELAAQIADDLGENVRSVVLFGTAVRGGFAPVHQDINILVIVADASTAAISTAGKALADAVRKGHSAPLIFSESEWQGSTDVFPIEIEDMREAHMLVSGSDPFDGLTTERDDLRRELEREARGKLLQLRAQYGGYSGNGGALTRLLIDSASTFFVLMRALVRLEGQVPATRPAELVAQAAAIAGLDDSAFAWVVSKISGDDVKALRANDPAASQYVDAIEKLAAYVDQA